jgi:hypothetical protein
MDTAIILLIIAVPTLLLAVVVVRLRNTRTPTRRSNRRKSAAPEFSSHMRPPGTPYTPMSDKEFAEERRNLREGGGAVGRVVADRGDLEQVQVELLLTGKTGGYLTPSERLQHVRAIGMALYRYGGHPEMLRTHQMVAAALGQGKARELESAWDGIGQWFG